MLFSPKEPLASLMASVSQSGFSKKPAVPELVTNKIIDPAILGRRPVELGRVWALRREI